MPKGTFKFILHMICHLYIENIIFLEFLDARKHTRFWTPSQILISAKTIREAKDANLHSYNTSFNSV